MPNFQSFFIKHYKPDPNAQFSKQHIYFTVSIKPKCFAVKQKVLLLLEVNLKVKKTFIVLIEFIRSGFSVE